MPCNRQQRTCRRTKATSERCSSTRIRDTKSGVGIDDDDMHSLTTTSVLLVLTDVSCMLFVRCLRGVARPQVLSRLYAQPRRLRECNPTLFATHEYSRGRWYATRGGGMSKTAAKKPRPQVPDYCDVEPRRDEAGNVVWPASETAMEEAREFIRQRCVFVFLFATF